MLKCQVIVFTSLTCSTTQLTFCKEEPHPGSLVLPFHLLDGEVLSAAGLARAYAWICALQGMYLRIFPCLTSVCSHHKQKDKANSEQSPSSNNLYRWLKPVLHRLSLCFYKRDFALADFASGFGFRPTSEHFQCENQPQR